MAELTGRKNGYSPGQRWLMHMFSRERTFGGHGIVAAQVPIGAGLAFAHKLRDGGKTWPIWVMAQPINYRFMKLSMAACGTAGRVCHRK